MKVLVIASPSGLIAKAFSVELMAGCAGYPNAESLMEAVAKKATILHGIATVLEPIEEEIGHDSARILCERIQKSGYDLIKGSEYLRVAAEKEPIVSIIELHGSREHEMYDDHPGLGSIFSNDFESHKAPPNCTLTQAMEASIAMFDKVNENEQGNFCASSIQLRDQNGGLLQEYVWRSSTRIQDWLRVMPTAAEWPEHEAVAAKLSQDANEERRWDNFESGKRLDQDASLVRRGIEIAKAYAQSDLPNFVEPPIWFISDEPLNDGNELAKAETTPIASVPNRDAMRSEVTAEL